MLENFMNQIFDTSFIFAVFRVTTPILFASLAALISDRAGVMNIGIEGIMLLSALTGVAFSAWLQSSFFGLAFAITLGALLGLLMGFFGLKLRTNLFLVGIAINLLGGGGSVLFMYLISGDRGYSSHLASKTIPNINIPIIENIPIIGQIISGHNILTYLSVLFVFLMHILLFKTILGLRIRAVGENKNAAASVGINVLFTQYIALAISGLLAGFGGAYLSMGYMSMFNAGMTAGRGFIALAAEALGQGLPFGTFLSALIFGFTDTISNYLQTFRFPPELVQMIPYVVTILALVIFGIRNINKS